MTTPSDAIDISIFWVAGRDAVDRTCLTMPDTTTCTSLADALDRAKARDADDDARPWIQADGVLFGPAQIDILRRLSAPAS